jgi:hypothetical protein
LPRKQQIVNSSWKSVLGYCLNISARVVIGVDEILKGTSMRQAASIGK